MSTIYWLASYPKSGNTWMRILLTNYLRDHDEPANINNLCSSPIASARVVFDEFIGVGASDLTQDEIEQLRPQVYKRIALEVKAPYFMKAHDAYSYNKQHQALFPQEATAGVLYLIRNPLDVAASFAHHSHISVQKAIHRMNNMAYSFCSNEKQLHLQLNQKLLTWSAHVNSWVDAPNLRVKVIRFEDLQADTKATFSKVIQFLGLDIEPERLCKAVEYSAFEQLAHQEKADGFREKAPRAQSFFRKGQVGTWREQMTSSMIEEVIAAHCETMTRFGYLDQQGQPVF